MLTDIDSWLDSRAIDDSLMAAGYEALGDGGRAILKKCIARMSVIWGERPTRESITRRWAQGFGLEREFEPSAYAAIVCDPAYRYPAAYLAAFFPAVLAGVRSILPFFLTDKGQAKPAPALLAALELSGIERAYAASEKDLAELPELMRDGCDCSFARGRLVLLGDHDFCERLAHLALRGGLPFRCFPDAPVYYSSRFCAPVEQRFEEDSPVLSTHDPSEISIRLDEEHKDFWIWPDLDPLWFMSRRVKVFSL